MSTVPASTSGGGTRPWQRRPLAWLVLGAPAAAVAERLGVPGVLLFLLAGLALLPLATWIVRATEELSEHTGPAAGGLLNASFGNLPELIIATSALRAGLFEMVRASLIGTVLANVLLALGIAFVLGGRRRHVQEFNPAAARTYSSMLLLASLSMIAPSSFHQFFSDVVPRHAQALDAGVAFVLLALYALYLLFMLRTHPDFFSVVKAAEGRTAARWSASRAVGVLVAASLGAAWTSELLVGAAESAGEALGMSETFVGIVLLAGIQGAAGSGAVIAAARKDHMDLAVGIAMGSSIQVVLFVTPALVLASRFVGSERLTLSFARTEVGALFLGVLIAVVICVDGRSNWFKGAQLVGFYLILAALFYSLPGAAA
jgi:Ca2+:H+ antiporter